MARLDAPEEFRHHPGAERRGKIRGEAWIELVPAAGLILGGGGQFLEQGATGRFGFRGGYQAVQPRGFLLVVPAVSSAGHEYRPAN